MAVSIWNAANIMGRAINNIVDPEPTGLRKRLVEYFAGACAYCGIELGPGVKACMDHANPGEGNHAGNRVLSCSPCNDEQKLDTPWRDFLRVKVADQEVLAERERRIHDWLTANAREPVTRSAAVREAEAEARAVIDEFRERCIRLREVVKAELED